MKYQERIKRRLIAYIAYSLIGIGMIVAGMVIDRQMILTLGVAFLVMGILRIVQYARLLKNPDALEAQEIAVTDERNILLSQKARSLAFSWFVFFAGIAAIVCFAMGKILIGQAIAFSMCAAVFLYWVIYLFLQKRQ